MYNILGHYVSLFQEGLGILKDSKVKFYIKEGATPMFFKAFSLPLALKQCVTAELDCLQAVGIISTVKVADWATPTVPVL